MSKSLYDEQYRYTQAGHELERQARAVLDPLFAAWQEQGYSPREMMHVLSHVVMDCELEAILLYRKAECAVLDDAIALHKQEEEAL